MKLEYDFTLPRGYVDKSGGVHRQGTMRLATAADEIQPIRDPRVQQNPEYLSILILSRVITQIEGCDRITPEIIESLYLADMNFLKNMYQSINEIDGPVIETTCPNCGKKLTIPLDFMNQK